jgi:hypothetical protein
VGGRLKVCGLGEFDYLSPWMCGWIERAVERFGGSEPKVRENSWGRGATASDVLEFDISWI